MKKYIHYTVPAPRPRAAHPWRMLDASMGTLGCTMGIFMGVSWDCHASGNDCDSLQLEAMTSSFELIVWIRFPLKVPGDLSSDVNVDQKDRQKI